MNRREDTKVIQDLKLVLKMYHNVPLVRKIMNDAIHFYEDMEEYTDKVEDDNKELIQLWNEIREENDELIAECNEGTFPNWTIPGD